MLFLNFSSSLASWEPFVPYQSSLRMLLDPENLTKETKVLKVFRKVFGKPSLRCFRSHDGSSGVGSTRPGIN